MPAPINSTFDARSREPTFSSLGHSADLPRAAAALPRASSDGRRAFHQRRRLAYILPVAFGTATAAALLFGWHNSEEIELTPGTGVGYWLGIAGASAMLLLLFYPLR